MQSITNERTKMKIKKGNESNNEILSKENRLRGRHTKARG